MAYSTTKLKLIAIFQCVLCFGKGNEQCSGYIHHDQTQIRNVISGQNVTLSCDLGSHCVRGVWAFRKPNGVKYLSEESCGKCGDNFSVTDVQSNPGINSRLIIYNINDNLSGIYDCNCQLSNSTTFRDSCFYVEVQMPTCKLTFYPNGKLQVFDNSSGQSREKEFTVRVDVNDKLNASCDETVDIKSNCKILQNGFLTRRTNSQQCYFSCKLGLICKTRILVIFNSSTRVASMSPITKPDISNASVRSAPATSSTTSVNNNGNDYNSTSIATSKDLPSLSTPVPNEHGSSASQSEERTSYVTSYNTESVADISVSILFTGNWPKYPIRIIISLSIFAIVLILIISCMLSKTVRDRTRRPSQEGTWDNHIYDGFKKGSEVIHVTAGRNWYE